KDYQHTTPTTSRTKSSSPPFHPSYPLSLEVLSINTPTRMLVAKPHSPPFTMIFNTITQTYGLAEFECEHTDFDIADPTTRLLHHLDPGKLGYVAWCSGAPFTVVTRSVDYRLKRRATCDRGAEVDGGVVNIGCVDDEGVEDLVAHFEERKKEGVKVKRIQDLESRCSSTTAVSIMADSGFDPIAAVLKHTVSRLESIAAGYQPQNGGQVPGELYDCVLEFFELRPHESFYPGFEIKGRVESVRLDLESYFPADFFAGLKDFEERQCKLIRDMDKEDNEARPRGF
ncbi:MAG: hypothetical protein Q9218_007932, partial [Villophora microphyllina]